MMATSFTRTAGRHLVSKLSLSLLLPSFLVTHGSCALVIQGLQEPEARGLRAVGQSEAHGKTLSQKNKKIGWQDGSMGQGACCQAW